MRIPTVYVGRAYELSSHGTRSFPVLCRRGKFSHRTVHTLTLPSELTLGFLYHAQSTGSVFILTPEYILTAMP